MKRNLPIVTGIFLFSVFLFHRDLQAQKKIDTDKVNREIYPFPQIQNMGWMSSYTQDTTILFEANPKVRYSFYNDFDNYLKDKSRETSASDTEKKFGKCFYVGFNPQLRMYVDNSLPVRMPGYQVVLGTQYGKLFKGKKLDFTRLAAISLESSHFSNGQAGSAFARGIRDETPASDSVYKTITNDTKLSDKLNRLDGNFSTNLTVLGLSYRSIKANPDNCIQDRIWHFQLEYTLYHDGFPGVISFGGC